MIKTENRSVEAETLRSVFWTEGSVRAKTRGRKAWHVFRGQHPVQSGRAECKGKQSELRLNKPTPPARDHRFPAGWGLIAIDVRLQQRLQEGINRIRSIF